MAWLTDGINIKRRNTALSIVGISIGTAVIIGFTMSSIIAGKLGIPWLFYICGAITFIAMCYTLIFLTNQSSPDRGNGEFEWSLLFKIIKEKDIILINLSGLISSTAMTGIFFMMPILISRHIKVVHMWKLFVPMVIVGTSLQYYFGKRADRIGTIKVALVGFAFEALGLVLPIFSSDLTFLRISLILFYAGYCILSPVLLAAISRHPDSTNRGSVMSSFNASQFIGAAIGGVLSGLLFQYSYQYVFAFLCAGPILALFLVVQFKDFASS